MRTFRYGLVQGIKNIWQNRLFSLAAIGTMVTCLFMLGLFYALVANFQNMVYHAESSVGLTVFFEEGVEEGQIAAIGKKIRACKTVEKVKYISPEEAWENFQQEMYGEEDLEDTFGEDNPLKDSASLEVYLSDVSNQDSITRFIQEIDGVRKVNGSSSMANGLSNFNMLVAYVSATIILLLLLVSAFLISTAVATGIRVRRDEISIMQYIGATASFVRMPFLVEGVLIGIVGAVIPLMLLWVIYERMVRFLLTHFSVLSEWLAFVSPEEIFRRLIPLSLGVGIGIGFLGSVLSVRKHLQR